MINNDFDEFCKNFNIVENALEMRSLKRWNGRDLRESENLAEHSHLVVCCIYDIADKLELKNDKSIDISKLVFAALHHDSLEMLRGDILSVTKDVIQGLRKSIDEEELKFMKSQNIVLSEKEQEILHLADLMACYKFVEYELRYPSNDFAKVAYLSTKNKYDEMFQNYIKKYNINKYIKPVDIQKERFIKGYLEDAGTDIILNKRVIFMPMSTTTIDLDVSITPEVNTMSFLCARTSAANKGLYVAMCPIDADYSGNISAIVHNLSNNIITYEAGESFCQYVTCNIIVNKKSKCKKSGKRTLSKLGGTDVSNN